MHELDPFQRFLGIEESDNPAEILGLSSRSITSASIEQSLRDRLARVYSHPDGRSSSAERVKKKLRWAAEELRKPRERERVISSAAQRANSGSLEQTALARPDLSRSPRPQVTLTEFDRQVIAILVSSGGWNANSRARLIALAAMNEVSVDGLFKVMGGLSEYGRLHGAHFDVADVTPDRPVVVAPRRSKPGEIARAAVKAAERLSPELREPDAWSTVKLSALFGLITIIAGVFFFRVLLTSPHQRTGADTQQTAVESPAELLGPMRDQEAVTSSKELNRYGQLARFETAPSFTGNSMPGKVTDAADESIRLPEYLEQLHRRVLVAEDRLSQADVRNWEESIQTVGTGWPHISLNLLREIEGHFLDVLFEASNKPAIADDLLNRLVPASRISEPVAINLGAWQAGMLGQISQSNLPPGIRDHARRLLGEILPFGPGDSTSPFRVFGRAWLDMIIPDLIEQSFYHDRYSDLWEMWLTAQIRIDRFSDRSDDIRALDNSLLIAIEQWLYTSTDLSKAGPGSNVLGRLLNHLHFESNRQVRERVLAWFEDENVTLDDLWVLTSILALYNQHTTWFKPDMALVERDLAMPYRRRVHDLVRDAWPAISEEFGEASIRATGRGLPVDQTVAHHWRAVLGQLIDAPFPIEQGDEASLERLLRVAYLNEAALLLVTGQEHQAQSAIDSIQLEFNLSSMDQPAQAAVGNASDSDAKPLPLLPYYQQQHPAATNRPGQALGSDGQWASAYEQAGRSVDDRVALLTQLYQGGGTDLGFIDSRLFVRQVYRGSPFEVRAVAQQILLARFIDGPNVALQMFDQFPDASATRDVSDVIESYTGVTLPNSNTREWQMKTRLALAEHVYKLRADSSQIADYAASALLSVYNDQLMHMRGGDMHLPSHTLPEALMQLYDQWRQMAATLVPSVEVPTDLRGIARRQQIRDRLSQGALQHFVSQQLAIMELIAYVTVAEQPILADQVREMLRNSARRRNAVRNVLHQAIEAELMIAQLWDLRMEGERLASVNSRDSQFVRKGNATPAADMHALGVPLSTLVLWPRAAIDLSGQDAEAAWRSRLERLNPNVPLDYFELAEEVADQAESEDAIRLARKLFSLAGALDRDTLGRSAALALADLEPDPLRKRRMLALAALLDTTAGDALGRIDSGKDRLLMNPEAILGVVDAISFYRQGYGVRAQNALNATGAMELLHALDETLLEMGGGVDRMLEDMRLYRSGQPPQEWPHDGSDRLLQVQAGLLAGTARSWSTDLMLKRRQPLLEVDPDDLAASFGIDIESSVFRAGRWQAPH